LYVFLIVAGGIAAKQQSPGIVFTQKPKISIFAPQWQLVGK